MRRFRASILLVLLALAVRVSVTAARDLSRPPVKDEWSYSEIARNVAAGNGLFFDIRRTVDGREVDRRLTSLRPPLYPLVLGGLYRAGGGVVVARLLSCLLGALAVGLLHAWGRRQVGEGPAIVAAALFAVWPSAVWASGEMLTEPLYLTLALGAMAALVAGRGLAAGVLLGLAALTRPPGLLLLVPAVVYVLRAESFALRRRVALAALTIPVLVLLAPWVARNTRLHGRPLLTTNAGVTFFGANNDRALADEWPGRWHLPEEVLAGDPPPLGYYGWPELTEAENDREFRRRGTAWIAGHPGEWFRLAGAKLLRFFDPDQHSGKGDRRLKGLAGWLSFGPALLLAAVGLGLAIRRRLPLILILGVIGAPLATSLIFYADVRARLPAIPGFLLLAGVGIGEIGARFGARSGLTPPDSRGASPGPGGA
jgi:4-amino-4-deoxy-L-arabinose transferase-like glycosyltransferase